MKTKLIFGVAAGKAKISLFATARITGVNINRYYAKPKKRAASNFVIANKPARVRFATILI